MVLSTPSLKQQTKPKNMDVLIVLMTFHIANGSKPHCSEKQIGVLQLDCKMCVQTVAS